MEDLENVVNDISAQVMNAENPGATELAIAQLAVSVAVFKALVLIHNDQATWKNQ